MTTYQCHTDPIPIYPGQNTNLVGHTKTCPNAQKVSGPGDASIFAPARPPTGYVTRFKPSMVEMHPDGSTTTPRRLGPAPPSRRLARAGRRPDLRLRRGEDDRDACRRATDSRSARDAKWGLNYMIHNLNAKGGRSVEITWEIDWVPETNPPRTDIHHDAAFSGWTSPGSPHIYPVFDAERGFDLNGDGKYVFPDEVPTDPNVPGYEERENISPSRKWMVPDGRGDARLRRRPPAPGRRAASTSGSPATVPTPARSTATTRPRSSRSSSRTRTTTSPRAR